MLPIIFINCDKEPFVDDIICQLKQYETRSRNTLGRFLGEPVLLAETRHGRRPVVKAYAVIDQVISVHTKEAWDEYLDLTWVPVGSSYDWQPNTKVKWLYGFKDVIPCTPFIPPEGKRHGRVWMEYEGGGYTVQYENTYNMICDALGNYEMDDGSGDAGDAGERLYEEVVSIAHDISTKLG